MGVVPEDRHLLASLARTRGRTKKGANVAAIRALGKGTGDHRDKMNKWERRFADWLEYMRAGPSSARVDWWEYEPFSLRLPGHSHRYIPDFVAVRHPGFPFDDLRFEVVAYEVKGHLNERSRNKMKVAAAVYPWIQFVMAFDGDRKSGSCPFELVEIPRPKG